MHLDKETTFTRGEGLSISFAGEDRYLVAVGVADQTPYATVIRRDRFFCNDSTTTVYVYPNGAVESMMVTNQIECPTPTDNK